MSSRGTTATRRLLKALRTWSGHGFCATGGTRQSIMTFAFLPASPAGAYTAAAYQAVHSRSHTSRGRLRSLSISAGANVRLGHRARHKTSLAGDERTPSAGPCLSFAPGGAWSGFGPRHPPLKRWAMVGRPGGTILRGGPGQVLRPPPTPDRNSGHVPMSISSSDRSSDLDPPSTGRRGSPRRPDNRVPPRAGSR